MRTLARMLHMGELDRFGLDCDGQESRSLRRFGKPTEQTPPLK
jgi:hypothetical protein